MKEMFKSSPQKNKKEYLVAYDLSHVKQLMLKITHASLKSPSHLWKMSSSSNMNSGPF